MAQPNRLLSNITGSLTGLGTTVATGIDATVKASNLVSQIIGVLTIFAFIWFGFQIILAGYQFISSSGDPKKAETARKRLTDGILGLLIVVVALGVSSLIASLLGVSNVFDLEKLFPQI
jgi:hypothetical protein